MGWEAGKEVACRACSLIANRTLGKGPWGSWSFCSIDLVSQIPLYAVCCALEPTLSSTIMRYSWFIFVFRVSGEPKAQMCLQMFNNPLVCRVCWFLWCECSTAAHCKNQCDVVSGCGVGNTPFTPLCNISTLWMRETCISSDHREQWNAVV